MLRKSTASLGARGKVNGYAPEKVASYFHFWRVNGYAPEKSRVLVDFIHFYVLL